MEEEFVGEPVRPVPGTMDVPAMARGEPGLPRRFTWRGETHEAVAVIARWKTTGPCRSGSGERYVRRHWFRVRTAEGRVMTLYFDRQPRRGGEARRRWWLFSATPAAGEMP